MGVPVLQYEWSMDTDPGWNAEGLWAWGAPTGGGGQHGNPDPTSGATGANVYGYNLSGDYENSLPETHLTTTAIDCTGLTDVSVRFQRYLNVESSTYDHAYFRVSNDGTSWTTVWENSAELTDAAWTMVEYDISGVADGQPAVYLRWTQGTTDGGWQYSGWNIDDVQIRALGCPGCAPPPIPDGRSRNLADAGVADGRRRHADPGELGRPVRAGNDEDRVRPAEQRVDLDDHRRGLHHRQPGNVGPGAGR